MPEIVINEKAPIIYISKPNTISGLDLSGTIAIRTDGLLGDNIIASTAFSQIRILEQDRPFIIYSTYHHNSTRILLLYDLFKELFDTNVIQLILHKGRGHGPLQVNEKVFLKSLGCKSVYDCAPWEEGFFSLRRSLPMLGESMQKVWNSKASNLCNVALFRWSGFHTHYPMRNRPWHEWQVIERELLNLGYQIFLFGWDDPLPCGKEVIDLRRKLSVYETLKHMAQCRFLISTVTFAPLFCQYYIPCFVLSDTRDIPNLRKRWCVLSRYIIFDVSTNYLDDLCKAIRDFSNE